METFYLLALIPVTIAIVAKFWFHQSITWLEFGIQAVVGILILAAVYFTGLYSSMSDTEIINGQVTEKVRHHDSYIESYQCNCRTSRVGKTTTTTCQTCYRNHYTVDWYLKSTIGRIQIDRADWTSRAVYALPNPSEYSKAVVGEHCAKYNSYTNYIKATPDSIFHNVGVFDKKLKTMVPPYPKIRNIYKVDRVIPIGLKRDEYMEALDVSLSNSLRTLGLKKQANINVIIAKTDSNLMRYAIEREWLGGKKNDVTVVIGAPNYPEIEWVDVFTFANSADNNTLTVNLRNGLLEMKGLYDLKQTRVVSGIITQNVEAHFKRKSMKDFEYLEDEIDPPTWVLVLSIVLSILLGVGLTWFFHHNELPSRRGNYRY